MMTTMITLQDITKTYQMGDTTVRALDGVTVSINKGEFVAITGPSGSGKSTLMNILGCLDRPTAGSYKLDGDEVATLNDDQLALTRNKKIGFVFQNFNLISDLTVTENIISPTYSSPLSKLDILESCDTLLEKLEMKAHSKKFPNQLSGGQKQRVAICRALINKPQILFADEPTGALNSTQGQQVLDIFTKINQEGQGIVMVTHDLKAALRGNRILYLKDGRITGELKIEPYHEDRIEERELCVYNFLKENGF